MEEREYNNIYAIPANYTDSGKILGGMLELRNAVEAGAIVLLVGYPELKLITIAGTIKIVIMTVTLIPLAVVAMMGIDGDSLFQYIGHIIRFMLTKRKLHFRRVGFKYDEAQLRKKHRGKSQAKAKGKAKNSASAKTGKT